MSTDSKVTPQTKWLPFHNYWLRNDVLYEQWKSYHQMPEDKGRLFCIIDKQLSGLCTEDRVLELITGYTKEWDAKDDQQSGDPFPIVVSFSHNWAWIRTVIKIITLRRNNRIHLAC